MALLVSVRSASKYIAAEGSIARTKIMLVFE